MKVIGSNHKLKKKKRKKFFFFTCKARKLRSLYSRDCICSLPMEKEKKGERKKELSLAVVCGQHYR